MKKSLVPIRSCYFLFVIDDFDKNNDFSALLIRAAVIKFRL